MGISNGGKVYEKIEKDIRRSPTIPIEVTLEDMVKYYYKQLQEG